MTDENRGRQQPHPIAARQPSFDLPSPNVRSFIPDPSSLILPLGVIFDMDGVLVDSYEAHFRSWRAVAASLGRDITQQEFDATFGQTSREIIAALWAPKGRQDPFPEKGFSVGQGSRPEKVPHTFSNLSEEEIARLDAQKEAAFRDILAADFPPMPGVGELLESLHAAGFGLAVGSSGPPENVDLILDKLGKRGLFGAIVHGMDVTRGKPDPQVFLLAAGRLGIPAQRCAVVEDAPLGIAAAKAAGMASVGLASTGRNRTMLSAADLIVDRLTDLSPTVFRDLILRKQGNSA